MISELEGTVKEMINNSNSYAKTLTEIQTIQKDTVTNLVDTQAVVNEGLKLTNEVHNEIQVVGKMTEEQILDNRKVSDSQNDIAQISKEIKEKISSYEI